MKKVFKNYLSTIILIFSIIVGTIIGLIFKDRAVVLKPLGDLFLNLLLVIIVPLIFLTITVSIGKMKTPKKIGKILGTTILIFIITSIISVFIGLLSSSSTKLINVKNIDNIKNELNINEDISNTDVNYLEKTVNTISVNNFNSLLTNENIIALIIFSIIFGLSINISKEKGKKLLDVLDSANNVVQSFIKIIMYYAPIGLGCYFSSLVGTFGKDIATGYTKLFIIYTLTCLFVYFIVYSLYAYIAKGKDGFKAYWKNILAPTLTSLATCSSAASIPVNIKASENIGVNSEVAGTVIPLGTSFHKDGSIIGSVFKIMFLVCLFNANISNTKILLISLLATLLVTAVPIGGGTISEMLIITSLGFPVSALPILTIIAAVIDAPATLLNVTGDTASSMLIDKIVNKHQKI